MVYFLESFGRTSYTSPHLTFGTRVTRPSEIGVELFDSLPRQPTYNMLGRTREQKESEMRVGDPLEKQRTLTSAYASIWYSAQAQRKEYWRR